MWRPAVRGTMVLLLLLLGGACSGAPSAGAPNPPPAASASGPAPVAAPATPEAPAVAKDPLRIMYATRDGGLGPLWIAEEAGIFAKYHIDAAMTYIGSGTLSMQSLLAREVDVGISAASAVVAAGLGGADTIYIGAMQRTFGLWIYAIPEITTAADLRGKRVGITRRNSTTDVGLSYYLRQQGLVPERDVVVVEVGEHSAMVAALQSGAIQATVTSSPTTHVAQRAGFRELADLTQLGVEYPMSTLVTTRSFATERRDVVERFLRAVWEGSHRYKTDRELALAVLAKYLQTDDQELLAAVYSAYTSRLVQDVPRAYPEGTRTILAELAPTHPQAQGADPAQFLDTSFMEALDREGLEQKLYGR